MLQKLKIGSKLIVSFLIIALIGSISGIFGSVFLNRIDVRYSIALEKFGFAQGKIGRLGMEMNSARAYIRDIVFLTDQAMLQTANQKIEQTATNVDQLLKEIEPTLVSQEGKNIFNGIVSEIEKFRDIRAEVIRLGMANQQNQAYDLWINKGAPEMDIIVSKIDALLENKEAGGISVSEDATNMTNISMWVMAIAIVSALAISMVLAYYISKGISRPVKELELAAKEMSKGNLKASIHHIGNDEIGSLAESMRMSMSTVSAYITDIDRMMSEMSRGNFDLQPNQPFIGDFENIEKSVTAFILNISQTLSQIKMAAEQVSSGSEQVSGGAQALAQGATEQASSVEELSASISEISAQVQQNASNANKANDMSQNTANAINQSNEQMQKLMQSMNHIHAKSNEISKIIRTIEDIAFQTNILALNAAVEAARAGVAGKGFAVVADEVRNLAGKSAEAAKSTTQLIEDSVSSINEGVKYANITANELMGVVEGAKSTTDAISEITSASQEQSTALSQISMGIDQISAVVQTNSATSEQSAAASEELSGQASLLKDLVAKFRLKPVEASGLEYFHVEEPAKSHYTSSHTDPFYSGKY